MKNAKLSRTLGVTLAVLLIAVSARVEAKTLEGQDQEGRVLSDRFDVSVGWFGANLSTDAAVGFGSVVGTVIDFENDLGLEEDIDSARLGGFWRFNRRHALTFSYLQLNRNGSRVVDEDIDFEDLRFTGQVDTKFDQGLLGIGYRYAFYNSGKIEAGLAAGFSIYQFDLELSGTAALLDQNGDPIEAEEFRTESQRITAPVPTFGIYLNYAVNPKLIFRYQASGFDFDASDFEARVTDNFGTLEWFFVRNVSFGVGISITSIRVKDAGASNPWEVSYRYSGLNFQFGFVF